MPEAAPHLRARLAEAFRTRRNRVLALLGASTPGAVEAPVGGDAADSGTGDDAEEALRRLMVRTWPRAAKPWAGEDDIHALLAELRQIAAPARDDLRFLDAWNNAYETVLEPAWDDPARREALVPVLTRYARLLESWALRLEERP